MAIFWIHGQHHYVLFFERFLVMCDFCGHRTLDEVGIVGQSLIMEYEKLSHNIIINNWKLVNCRIEFEQLRFWRDSDSVLFIVCKTISIAHSFSIQRSLFFRIIWIKSYNLLQSLYGFNFSNLPVQIGRRGFFAIRNWTDKLGCLVTELFAWSISLLGFPVWIFIDVRISQFGSKIISILLRPFGTDCESTSPC